MEANEKAKLAVKALEDKKAYSVKILDITKISTLADYFIIAGGSNKLQVQAMADEVERILSEQGVEPNHIEGYRGAEWILMDYSDVIIHVFDEKQRQYFDLERIWRDGKSINSDELEK